MIEDVSGSPFGGRGFFLIIFWLIFIWIILIILCGLFRPVVF